MQARLALIAKYETFRKAKYAERKLKAKKINAYLQECGVLDELAKRGDGPHNLFVDLKNETKAKQLLNVD